MIKKFVFSGLLVSLFFITACTANAESYGKEDRNVSAYQGLTFDTEKAYKIYELKNENIITEFDKSHSLETNISDEYIFNIPINNNKDEMVGVASFEQENGKFELISYEKMDEKQKVLTDAESLNLLLNNQNLPETPSEFSDAKTIVMYKYNTYAIYLSASDGEYIIPISTNPLLTQLKEKTAYTAQEFIDILKLNNQENIVQPESSDPADWIVGGGAGNSETENKTVVTAVLGVSIIGLVAAILKLRKIK